MKYIFLLNTFSLKENTENLKRKTEKVCQEKNLDFIIEKNSEESSTEEIIRKYKNKKVILLPVGGDGTINRVLNAMDRENNILGYIPYGTGNDFYRANKELLKDGINKIDLVKINNMYFINVACFGIDAEIGNHSDIIHSNWIPKLPLIMKHMKKNIRPYVSVTQDITEEDIKLLQIVHSQMVY